jgi:sugar phosphate isomerase/epimerase
MKFAFSTIGCPQWDFPTLVAKAKEYGYAGVEIRGFLNENTLTAANPFVGDPSAIRKTFAAANIAVACLSSSLAFTGSKSKDEQQAADLRRYIDTAQALACPLVRIQDMKTRPGLTTLECAARLNDWLIPLADYAADRQVTILVENCLSLRRAHDLWTILESLDHPAVAAAWDVLTAAVAHEKPAVSIPVLNARIQLVHVRDAILSNNTIQLCSLGQGSVALQDLFKRLQGIGYQGWVSFDSPKALFPQLPSPEEAFPAAVAKLKEWTQPPVAAKPVKEPPKKPAVPSAAAAS